MNKVTEAQLAQNWVLTSIDGQQVAKDESAPTLNLNAAMEANGFAGCNRYFGKAELKDGKLRLDNMGMTRMACAEPEMKLEDSVAKSLSDWSAVSVKGGQMTLTSGEHSLVFAPAK